MTFKQAIKTLNIEDYEQRIINSNSHGELFHLQQYIFLAQSFEDDPKWFRDYFKAVVEYAEQNWQRPESIFQHIQKVLIDSINKNNY